MVLETRDRPTLALAPGPSGAGAPRLARGRAHEVAGAARRTFAAWVAGRLSGPVLWILAGRSPGVLDPEGLCAVFDPGRLVVARARRPAEGLWAAEEALRSGVVPLVVLEAAAPPGLTPVRRLNLAAEAEGRAPLCLILSAEGGAAAAVETRWRVEPAPGWARGGGLGSGLGGGVEGGPEGGLARWRVALLRDKAGPPGSWEAVEDGRGRPRFRTA
jgi:protein ImuA